MDQTALLLKLLEQLKNDMARDQEAARDSRAKIHARMDDIVERIGKMETTAAIAGQIDAQVRDELDALKKRLDPEEGDVGSTVAAWQGLMKTGSWISWVLGVAGLTSTGALVAFVTGAWDFIRDALRIS